MSTRAKNTYGQNWPAINAAQTGEKLNLLRLLYELCLGVFEPEQSRGRRRLPIADILFSMVLRVYSTISCRRFMFELEAALKEGLISKVPRYNSIFTYFNLPFLTPYLGQLVTESSLPLRAVERDFAVDSSGFSTSNFGRWLDVRFGDPKVTTRRGWRKVHLMCGVTTNIVTSAQVSDPNAGDSPFFKPLVETTDQNFAIRETSADKAYSSLANLKLIVNKGGTPYIPFKVNAKAEHGSGDPVWTKLFYFYSFHREEFDEHYHKRSNVETTFSMIKSKFGERLRSRREVAQENEVLCKVICHNLCVLVQSMFELGIDPIFWTNTPKAA